MPLETPYTMPMTFRMPKQVAEWLQAQAKRTRRTMTSILLEAIEHEQQRLAAMPQHEQGEN